MKQIIFMALVGLSAISAFARGGNGSHGGNTELSTQAEVKSAIHVASLHLPGLLWYWANRPTWVDDLKARAMIIQITSKTRYQSLADGKDAPFRVIENGGCVTDGKDNAGAATLGEAKTKFCLSVPEIQRIPPLSLNEQVGPLMGHELAHQAGYEEEDARYFQKFLLGVYKHAPDFHDFQRLVNLASVAAYDVEEGLLSSASSATVCLAVGKLKTAQTRLEDFDATTMPVFPDGLASRTVNRGCTDALESFCERGAPDSERSSLAEKARKLRIDLKKAESKLHSLTSSITLITEIPIFVGDEK